MVSIDPLDWIMDMNKQRDVLMETIRCLLRNCFMSFFLFFFVLCQIFDWLYREWS